jgi:hypothetical protein
MRIKRRTKRFFRRVLLSIPVIAALWFLYLLLRRPSSQPPANITVQATPDRIARGDYLFNVLLDCNGCHSERDFTRLGGPFNPKERGKGAVMNLQGLPGLVYAPNITPDKETGIGNWTAGEIIRAVREGIAKDGRMLFPMMPYQGYRYLSDADSRALVAYMQSLPAVRNYVPRTSITFPTSMFMKSAPSPVTKPIPPVDPDGGEIYGEYLVTVAGCEECHTKQVRGSSDPAMRYAGGREFISPFGTVVSANITPDKDTGIGKWDFVRFRDRMHSFRMYQDQEMPKVGPERYTLMPFEAYANLTDHDLEAIYLYLMSRRPITNFVVPHPGHSEIKD